MKYFCWERTFDRSWIPVMYTEKPLKKRDDQGPERSKVHEIRDTLTFQNAIQNYPAPQDEA